MEVYYEILVTLALLLALFLILFSLDLVIRSHLVPALIVLAADLKIPQAVAGSTILAAGTSSPAVCASLIGVLQNSSVGSGTVVGSDLFNMLVVVGIACFAIEGESLAVGKKAVLHDSIWTTLSIIALVLVISDGDVQWWEALLLLFLYALFICSVLYNIEKPSAVADSTQPQEKQQLMKRSKSYHSLSYQDAFGRHFAPLAMSYTPHDIQHNTPDTILQLPSKAAVD
eukprot:TRINITY_DN3539_c0_g1::TRINITY_DN3539_c0_g1_i1::g.18037::m.18037 TRINITY_DN3539_c0_g1::TRINITY_DN3539_c0_g1_i1::g.18037  ORF type:complete len:228 (+),score=32.62,sp/Q9HC58/NCKX3_HUMAN/39.07/1e-24,Na_Ca_ex/PF01699.19/1e+03,Na_Ca_ex/PF01699.19/8.2e-18,DUF788/PF05620.6/5.3e+02,DUF788/PF05620.6/0.02,DUF843/PF05814.6/3.7e+02,DUF843/PF05814.6/0.7,YfhO/PF09586.5/3.2 TRINITY_DN3539_c0_g1_i1:131-814(+)